VTGRTPVVSVVVPTRNRRGLLEEAVDSVVRQTFEDWELVVVDDASEDDTWAWLQTLEDPRIRKIRLEEHSEQSTTRNAGLRAARGEFFVSLDDDDMLAEDALEVHIGSLRRHREAVASVGGFTAFDESGAQRTRRVVRRRTARHIWRDVLFIGQSAFRTEALRSIGGWNESFVRATDHEMWSRLARFGPVVLLPERVLFYRVHGGQWRPPDLDEIITRAREVAVRQTDGAERGVGERALQARAFAETAFSHYANGRAGKALLAYMKAARTMPSLLRSPLSRPKLLRPMLRCLVGSPVLRAFRGVRRWRRGRQGAGSLDFSVRSTGYPEHVSHLANETSATTSDPAKK